jgi:hypothetical protein
MKAHRNPTDTQSAPIVADERATHDRAHSADVHAGLSQAEEGACAETVTNRGRKYSSRVRTPTVAERRGLIHQQSWYTRLVEVRGELKPIRLLERDVKRLLTHTSSCSVGTAPRL